MDNDDALVGRILTRREALRLLGSASLSAAFLAACQEDAPAPAATSATMGTPSATAASVQAAASASANSGATVAATVPACIVRPALTEGPYFVDERLNRSDIRVEPSDNSIVPGIPLVLTFQVASIAANACNAASGVMVDVWQCDAAGRYSDVQDAGFNTKGKKFLRGHQVTDATGRAAFITIYPGWYPGRAAHIHFKVRTMAVGRASDFTSQVFFDESTSDQVYTQTPYNRPGTRMRNASDGIFRQDGNKLLLNLTKTATGYASTFEIGLQSA